MRTKALLRLLFIGVSLLSCNKDNDDFSEGSVSFWTDRTDLLPIEIYIDLEYVGAITQEFTEGKPECGDAKTITYKGLAGKREYDIYSKDSLIYFGDIDIDTYCQIIKIQ